MFIELLVIVTIWRTRGAIHSTKISGNFGPKLNGSVRSNRKSFEKTGPPFEVVHFSRSDRLEFWLNGSRPRSLHFCILHPAYILFSVCSLHFTLCLHFTPGPQSAVCSPQSAFYTEHEQVHTYIRDFTIRRRAGRENVA